MARRHKIKIKNAREIDLMRVAGQTASEILQTVAKAVTPGITTGELDQMAAELMKERNCKSAFLGYRGFPGYTCLSVNEEVVHGIGGKRKLQMGDIIKIDVGVVVNGWIGDNATTVPVGDVSEEIKRLMAATEQSLYESIDKARAGLRLAELCGAVEAHVKPLGFTVVREFVGHGVGRDLHEEPQVPNYRPQGKTPILEPGMVLAIEPMVNAGTGAVKFLEDGWTVITADGAPSSHFEHTVLITDGDPELLTARPREATPEILGIQA
ncbi:type I methionyl aminopeptidase [Haloferula rosea]|uniref:Methionine aminopeptidase n=1 Tax=Haloferula rosea TaxID=490093 RepID=A0A934VCU4_9BACT|nr:type I methionyl aminopeptidase [Haloferula rosea]MBK1825604.1 type I methionyl aminopeptidase [Haloferula rosea]